MGFLRDTWRWLAQGIAVRADRMDMWKVRLLYLCSLLILTFPLAAVFGSMSEPYPDLRTYLNESLETLPLAAVFSVICCFVISQGICIIMVMVGSRLRWSEHQAIYGLSAFVMGVVMLPWSVLAALKIYSHPFNSFTVSRPAWLDSWPIQGYGFVLWLPTAVVVWVFLAESAKSAFYRLRNPGLCRGCLYDLTGNTSGVCPECGRAVDVDQVALTAAEGNEQD